MRWFLVKLMQASHNYWHYKAHDHPVHYIQSTALNSGISILLESKACFSDDVTYELVFNE